MITIHERCKFCSQSLWLSTSFLFLFLTSSFYGWCTNGNLLSRKLDKFSISVEQNNKPDSRLASLLRRYLEFTCSLDYLFVRLPDLFTNLPAFLFLFLSELSHCVSSKRESAFRKLLSISLPLALTLFSNTMKAIKRADQIWSLLVNLRICINNDSLLASNQTETKCETTAITITTVTMTTTISTVDQLIRQSHI